MKLRYNTINSRKFEAHWLVINEVKPHSNVLDIGCATGYIAKELRKKDCKVWGIEIDKGAAKIAESIIEKVYVGDIKDVASFNLQRNFFDYILLQDVIEHIVDIEPILVSLKKYIKKDGRIIISTPNIANISSRLQLVLGKFEYTETGIMDRTHVHFYTKKTLLNLLEKMKYIIEKIDYSSDFGQIPLLGRYLRHTPKVVQYKVTQMFPTLLGIQFIIVSKPIV